MKLFVLDPDTIYRRGLVASLELMPEVDRVAHAATVAEAVRGPGLRLSELVIFDPAGADEPAFIASVDARVLVCSADITDEAVLSALRAGAVGYLRKEGLTIETLSAAVRAAAHGAAVLDHGRSTAARLTEREQQVLALIAAGHPTREVAEQLFYSERTVKNVLHGVVTKLNARSRSQAVAFAVREGLI